MLYSAVFMVDAEHTHVLVYDADKERTSRRGLSSAKVTHIIRCEYISHMGGVAVVRFV